MSVEEELNRVIKCPYRRSLVNLAYTANWVNHHTAEKLKEYGVTLAQYNVLTILLENHPEACNAGEIKEALTDKMPDLTRLVDRMVEKGWVNRMQCPDNRRKVEISLTGEGVKLLNTLVPVIDDYLNAGRNISIEEAETLNGTLDKLRRK